jgi:hypothetical protein
MIYPGDKVQTVNYTTGRYPTARQEDYTGEPPLSGPGMETTRFNTTSENSPVTSNDDRSKFWPPSWGLMIESSGSYTSPTDTSCRSTLGADSSWSFSLGSSKDIVYHPIDLLSYIY